MTSVRFLMGLRTLADPQPHQRKENPQMTDATSTIVNRTLRRLPNAAYRPREYLTKKEVDRLIEVARKRGRNGARDAAAILLAYRNDCERKNSVRFAGRRSTSGTVAYMLIELRAGSRVCILGARTQNPTTVARPEPL